MTKLGRALTLKALFLAAALGASAGTVGPGCDNCFGGVFGLSGVERSAGPGLDAWTIFYDIDLTGYNGPASYYISEVAVKLVGGPNSLKSVTLNSALSSSNIGDWNAPTLNGNLGNGCGGGGNGWFCVGGGKLVGGDTYRLAFDVLMTEGSMVSETSIQANWDPPTGVLLSQKVSVPEGVAGELSLLVGGIGGLLFWRKRRFLRQ